MSGGGGMILPQSSLTGGLMRRTLTNNLHAAQDDTMKMVRRRPPLPPLRQKAALAAADRHPFSPVQVYIQRLQAALLSINYKRKYIQERFQRAREELQTEIRTNKRLRTVLDAHLRLPGDQVRAAAHRGREPHPLRQGA
jgi:hypothetical protein